MSVEYSEGSMAALREMIASKTPLIALVRTSDLPHWPIATNHAVVVTGYETGEILMNDPSFADHPLKVSAEAFELAWMAFDYRYAVISSQD